MTVASPRMTRTNSFDAQIKPLYWTPNFDGFNRIGRTCWGISARLRKYWTNDPLIDLHQKDERPTQNFANYAH